MRAFDFAFGQKSNSSSLRSRPHPALRATFSRFAGEGLDLPPQKDMGRKPFPRFAAERLDLPSRKEVGRKPFSRFAGERLSLPSRKEVGRKPFSRLREKVPGGRMRGRERSDACL